MKAIYLTIKKYWLQKIISGEKIIEYRDMKPYYINKFSDVKFPFLLKLRAGYNLSCPTATLLISKITKNLKTKQFELHIKDIINSSPPE